MEMFFVYVYLIVVMWLFKLVQLGQLYFKINQNVSF